MATVTIGGNEVHTSGELPEIGSQAPDFSLTNAKLQDVGLEEFAGKKLLLSINPSLDTSTCAAAARTFFKAIADRDDAVAIVITADLPFAQSRFCETEGLENLVTLSTWRGKQFAKNYGLLLTDGPLAGVATRAVVVIDESGKVLYTQLVPEVSQEPDYEAALNALG